MSSTLKYWLVINFEAFLLWFTLLLFTVFCVFFAISIDLKIEEVSDFSALSALWFIYLFIAAFAPKYKKLYYGRVLIVIVIFSLMMIFGVSMAKDDTSDALEMENLNSLFTWFCIVFPVAIAIGAWFAHYTYKNFEEVVSRQMRYRSSNVKLFESRWKYTFNKLDSVSYTVIVCLMALTTFLR